MEEESQRPAERKVVSILQAFAQMFEKKPELLTRESVETSYMEKETICKQERTEDSAEDTPPVLSEEVKVQIDDRALDARNHAGYFDEAFDHDQ